MTDQLYGGNVVRAFSRGHRGTQVLGAGPYEYSLIGLAAGETLRVPALRSHTIYVLAKPAKATLTIAETGASLAEGDAVQVEDAACTLTAAGEGAEVLVAGTAEPHGEAQGVTVTRQAGLYRVEKPWGHELWINGQHPRYALKQIFVKQGTKTSLQYHHFKQETNALFEGTARLHYQANPDVRVDDVRPEDVASVEIRATTTVGVTPPTLHRLEAVTDILLYETSTPHLDDVVRVQDDSRRPDGRIAAEHGR